MEPSKIRLMVIAVIAGIAALFGLNAVKKLGYFNVAEIKAPLIQIASIKSISIVTPAGQSSLSIEDALKVGEVLASLKTVKKSLYPIQDPSIHISKVIIRSYNNKDTTLIPWAFEGRNLVFQEESTDNYLIESSGGELYTLLKKGIPSVSE